MKVGEILEYLDKKYPLGLSGDYDNVGLLIGDPDASVKNAVVSLDCTLNTLELALKKKAELIITHHPVIFEPLKAVLSDSIVFSLIKNNISVISLHTNLDQAIGGVNDCLAQKIGLNNIKEYITEDGFSVRLGELSEEISAEEFAEKVANAINPHIKYTGKNSVKKVAVCSGSGSGFAGELLKISDALVTADVKHNVFVTADALFKTVIDAGHFETEDIIIPELAKELSGKFHEIAFFEDRHSVIKYI